MKNIKICFFGTYFYSYSRNAVLRKGLKKNGVDVVEVHISTSTSRFETEDDMSVNRLVAHIFEKVRIVFSLIASSKKVLSCDVIFVPYPGHVILPIAWVFSVIGRKKLVFDAYTSIYDTVITDRKLVGKESFKGKALKHIETILLKLPHVLLVDTPLMKKYIASEFHVPSKKIVILPVGADDSLYVPLKKNFNKDTVNVVWFGGYSPLQGVEYIIRATKLLVKQTAIHFILIGDGVLKKEIMKYSQKYNLKNVTFISHLAEKDLAKHITHADIVLGIFANNSMSRRVVPNKVIAGIASKKLVITASLPSLEKVFVHNKNIMFSKAENPQDLAKKIVVAAQKPMLREEIGANAYVLYRELFTPEKVAQIFMKGVTN